MNVLTYMPDSCLELFIDLIDRSTCPLSILEFDLTFPVTHRNLADGFQEQCWYISTDLNICMSMQNLSVYHFVLG